MKQAEQILKELGIRVTPVRLLVLREIIAHDHTFTLADMERRLNTLDRSSIFRALTLLVEHQVLHEVDNGSGSKLFCLCACTHKQHHIPHLHFTCTVCHETYCIKDIDVSAIPHPEGYEVHEVNLVMKGVCPKCRS